MCKLKTVLWINVLFFSVVAILHLARLLFQWKVTLNDSVVGIWLSGVGVALGVILLYLNAKHLKRKK